MSLFVCCCCCFFLHSRRCRVSGTIHISIDVPIDGNKRLDNVSCFFFFFFTVFFSRKSTYQLRSKLKCRFDTTWTFVKAHWKRTLTRFKGKRTSTSERKVHDGLINGGLAFWHYDTLSTGEREIAKERILRLRSRRGFRGSFPSRYSANTTNPQRRWHTYLSDRLQLISIYFYALHSPKSITRLKRKEDYACARLGACAPRFPTIACAAAPNDQ